VPEANAPDRVADSPAREREGDKEPRCAAPALAQRSPETGERSAPQQPIVDPVIKEAVDAPAAQPEAAVPAIGCEPTNRDCGANAATSSWTADFTDATSVRRTVGVVASIFRSKAGKVVTGDASTTSASSSAALISADSSVSTTENPSRAAARRVCSLGDQPKTGISGAADLVNEPPISPRPSTHSAPGAG